MFVSCNDTIDKIVAVRPMWVWFIKEEIVEDQFRVRVFSKAV